MKIITWNVNSVRARLERLLGVLRRHQPDVLCLQETKTTDDRFPQEVLREAGYHTLAFGQKTYNGVALISREPATDVIRGFAGNPIPEQARVLSAAFGGVRVVDVYVVNGREVGHEQYDLKLAWIDALHEWIRRNHRPADPLLVTGDFNITPADIDIHDPTRWKGKCLASDPERERLRTMLQWGLHDLHRAATPDPGVYSWWDYRFGAFHRDWGLRIDLMLGTAPLLDRLQTVEVDREERKKGTGEGNPSDHAPVVLSLR